MQGKKPKGKLSLGQKEQEFLDAMRVSLRSVESPTSYHLEANDLSTSLAGHIETFKEGGEAILLITFMTNSRPGWVVPPTEYRCSIYPSVFIQ